MCLGSCLYIFVIRTKFLTFFEYSLMPQRDYQSGGSWKIQNEMPRLHSKAMEIMKPNEPNSFEAAKLGNENVNLASNGLSFCLMFLDESIFSSPFV